MAAEDEDAFAATMAPTSAIALGSVIRPPDSAPAHVLPLVATDSYQLDKEIARGGMGRIVAADDQRLGRRVALKVLLEPAGDALGRFEREALITARLQHPGIVPVYEAGRWPSGEPFFAMKLVKGRPLDRVIADAKTLDERLALLSRVAAATDAMAYAHDQRVVHRDLKPANVLIGDFGETVVIDWGLAKDLDASDGLESAERLPRAKTAPRESRSPTLTGGTSTLTVVGAVMGTPAYMAPEQARGEAVDQRADVFALGAMLYHLLAGAPPYNARTATDVIAAAALGKVTPLIEREPRAPADLVAIVQRAMAQDVADRYPHAGELAEELRRFLTGQLVAAHQYTTLQRVMRFVRRHRAAVTIGTLAVLTLSVGGTFAVREVVSERDIARHQRRLADSRRNAAEDLIDKILHRMREELLGIGRLDLLASVGNDIRTYYRSLDTTDADEDLTKMAQAVDMIGGAERDLGSLDAALASFQEARERLVANVGADTTARTFKQRVMIARLDFGIGTALGARGRRTEARDQYVAAKSAFTALLAEQPSDRWALLYAAETHDKLGDLARNDGKLEDAYNDYAAAKAARELASKQASTRPRDEVMALSTSHMKLATIYQARGETGAALDAYRTALNLRETVLESDSDNMDFQWKVLEVRDSLAELQRLLGDAASAVKTYELAMPIMDTLVQRDPLNVTWRVTRGNLMSDLGFAQLDEGEFAAGLEHLEAAIAAQEAMAEADPKSATAANAVARSYLRAGDALVYLGRSEDAIVRYEKAKQIRTMLSERDPKSAAYRRGVAWASHKLANAYFQTDQPRRAIAMHEEVLPARAKLVEESPKHTGYINELASTEITLGRFLAGSDPARGTRLVNAGLERVRALAAADPLSNEWKETITQGLLARAELERITGKKTAERDALVEARSIAEVAAQRAPQNWTWAGFLAEIHAGLADLNTAAGDTVAASAAWKTCLGYLEPLALANHLPAARKALYTRAKAAR